MTKAEKAFRELREIWFNAHLRRYPHEREWNDLDEHDVNRSNTEKKIAYDEDTEAILRGENRKVDPECWNDLGESA